MLLGGGIEEVMDRYAQLNPIELVPMGIPIRLVHGALDTIVPLQQSRDFEEQARSKGDDVQMSVIQGAAHFDLIAPFSSAWGRVKQTVLALLKR